MYRALPLLVVTYLSSTMSTARAAIDPAFETALKDPQEQAMIVDTAKRSNVVIEDPCKDPFVKIGDQIRIRTTPQFDQGGKLISGSWVQEVFYAGCGVARILHVLVTVEAGSRPATVALLPGTTHADPILQKDVFMSPDLQRRIDRWRDPKCAKAYVDDTAFIDQESTTAAGAKGPRWREAWTIAACGRKQVILVQFTPDATGTTFVIFGKNP